MTVVLGAVDRPSSRERETAVLRLRSGGRPLRPRSRSGPPEDRSRNHPAPPVHRRRRPRHPQSRRLEDRLDRSVARRSRRCPIESDGPRTSVSWPSPHRRRRTASSEAAWTRLAARAVGVIFDGWQTLQQNDGALAEAAAFAEALALNPGALRAAAARRRHRRPRDRDCGRPGRRRGALAGVAGRAAVDRREHAARDTRGDVDVSARSPGSGLAEHAERGSVNFVAGPTGPPTSTPSARTTCWC